MVLDTSCRGEELCDEFRPNTSSTFTHTYRGDPPSRLIFSVGGFSLVVDLSPLTLGHLLLVPERHYLSFGQLATDLGSQVERIIWAVWPLYRAAFGRVVILEHGSSSGLPSACITHAHWHIAPLDGRHLRQVIEGDGLKPIVLNDFGGLRRFAEADQPYYYCYDGRDHIAYDAVRRPRAQYLRSVMGMVLGIPEPEWDWSLVIRRDLLRTTLHMTSHWRDQLTERIEGTPLVPDGFVPWG